MKIFKEVSYTLDEKVVGKEGSAFQIKIESKDFFEYTKEYNKDIFMHLKNYKIGRDFLNMPENLEGKLFRRKKIIDIMDNSPYFLGLDLIVSEKVKIIVENLGIDTNEYCFKKIKIKNTGDDCYLLLVPIIDYDELIFEKSVYRRKTYDDVFYKQYSSNEDRLNDEDKYKYDLHKGYISEKFNQYDIVNLRAGRLYFSERLINAFIENNVVGLDVHSSNEVIAG